MIPTDLPPSELSADDGEAFQMGILRVPSQPPTPDPFALVFDEHALVRVEDTRIEVDGEVVSVPAYEMRPA